MRSPSEHLSIAGPPPPFETGAKRADRSRIDRKSTSLATTRVLNVIGSARGPSLAWVLTLMILIIDGIWLVLGEWTVAPASLVPVGMALAAFWSPLCFDRYRGDVRISATLRAGALLSVFTAATAILSYLIVSTNAELVDGQLAAWDRAIGFDWLALFRWMRAHPSVHAILEIAYSSGLPQMACVVVYLGFAARTEQLHEYLYLYMAAVLVVIAFSWPFPAAGPWTHYSLGAMLDASSMSHFNLLRDGSLRTLDLREMQGLIAVPSLHTALAVILAYAMRGTRLFWAFALLNGLMILATPIEGGHYLVDVLAGAVLAMALIACSRIRGASADRRTPR